MDNKQSFDVNCKTIVQNTTSNIAEAATAFEISYKVFRNDVQIASLMIRYFVCGAGCSLTHHYFVFDVRTGRQIAVHDLFSKKGAAILSRRLIPYWSEQSDYFKYQTLPTILSGFLSDKFAIADSKIIFLLQEFSSGSHGDSYHSIAYSINAVSPYLDAFGRRILLGESTNVEQANNFDGQIYRGYVGDSAVIIILEKGYNNFIGGKYYWIPGNELSPDQEIIPGYLRGTEYKKDSLIMPIDCWNNKDSNVCRAKITLNGLRGVWMRNGITKPFSVSLD